MNTWFTADTHFCHTNIIRHCGRPFANANHMNEMLIKMWNAKVGPKDPVYILGDFALCPVREAISIVERLNGKLHLIEGNHDRKLVHNIDFRSLFTWVEKMKTVRIGDPEAPGGSQAIVLCHYALRVWDKSHYGSWNLHGHSHGTLPPIGRQLDVGIDAHLLDPIDYDTVKRLIMKEPIEKPDHHTGGDHDPYTQEQQ